MQLTRSHPMPSSPELLTVPSNNMVSLLHSLMPLLPACSAVAHHTPLVVIAQQLMILAIVAAKGATGNKFAEHLLLIQCTRQTQAFSQAPLMSSLMT